MGTQSTRCHCPRGNERRHPRGGLLNWNLRSSGESTYQLGKGDVSGGTGLLGGGNSMDQSSKATEEVACMWDDRLFNKAGEQGAGCRCLEGSTGVDREGMRNLDIFLNAMVESGLKQGKYILYKSLGHKMEIGVGGTRLSSGRLVRRLMRQCRQRMMVAWVKA